MAIFVDIIGKKTIIPFLNRMPPLIHFEMSEGELRNIINFKEWKTYCSISKRLITKENIEDFMTFIEGVDKDESENSKVVKINIDVYGPKIKIPYMNLIPPIENFETDETVLRNLIKSKGYCVYAHESQRLINEDTIDDILGITSSKFLKGNVSANTDLPINPNILNSISIDGIVYKVTGDASVESRITNLETSVGLLTSMVVPITEEEIDIICN